MRTLIYRLLMCLSLIVAAAVAWLWPRSYRTCDGVHFDMPDGSRRELVSYMGAIQFTEIRPGFIVFVQPKAAAASGSLSGTASDGRLTAGDFSPYGASGVVTGGLITLGGWNPTQHMTVVVPYWLPLAISLLLPAYAMLGLPAALRRWRR